jgi:primosomal protein N' (replication factor Y) (superfamily II helicase)
MERGKIVKVSPLLLINKTFNYQANEKVEIGDLVLIEFGKVKTYGVVIDFEEENTIEKFSLKLIDGVVLTSLFCKKLLNFIARASNYNVGNMGMFLKLSFPFSRFRIPEVKETDLFDVSLSSVAEKNSFKSKIWLNVWEEMKGGDRKDLKSLKIPSSELAKFSKKGLFDFYKKFTEFEPKTNLANLSSAQNEAFNQINKELNDGFKVFLLNGETGSDKTEVYFHLINEIIQNKGQVLLTLPEIALSSVILKRFKERFGFDAILWHSSVSEKNRINNFLNIQNGKASVVIGTRSSIFLPFKNLKLIIVDEEHDNSYKQEDISIYHGRDMAVLRGFVFKIPVLLGSATPSIESYNNAIKQKYKMVNLHNRFFVTQMPKIHIVDMKNSETPKNTFVSPLLKTKMLEVLKSNGQVMFFLNRRGYAPIVLCQQCGGKIKCKFCDVNLTEHRIEGKLKCHHCGFVAVKPNNCSFCEAENSFKVIGVGVERIKEELETLIPPDEIVLLTSDVFASSKKTREIMHKIESGKAKVIVGTQVVSKGYHFPNLKMVGVLDADFGLNIEDFRAFEKTFQLLYQVAGRTGREKSDGEVYIQTYDPKNKVLFSIANYDKDGFYKLELEARIKFKLPPTSKQIAFIVSGEDREKTQDCAKKLSLLLGQKFLNLQGFSIFGPSVPIISFLRNKYRFRILILSTKVFALQEEILDVINKLNISKSISVRVDVDPLTFY